jgi:hypothetical protein
MPESLTKSLIAAAVIGICYAAGHGIGKLIAKNKKE